MRARLLLSMLLLIGGSACAAAVSQGAGGETEASPGGRATSPPPASVVTPPPLRTAAREPPGGLAVHFIDVGQGDATLLLATDSAVLVDAGRHDRADVTAYLREVGVEALDVVAITHPHADHVGQFDAVMAAFDVSEVWWSGASHTTPTFERALTALEGAEAAYGEPRADDVTTVGDLEFEFLNPGEDADFGDLHDSGLVFRVTYGDVRFLFSGDAGAATEARAVSRYPALLEADVYQVGHHGSRTSTSEEFLAAVSPSLAIYSAGAGNQYGHPYPEVIERLARSGVETYGTDVHGTVVITTDGTAIAVDTEHAAPPIGAGGPGGGDG